MGELMNEYTIERFESNIDQYVYVTGCETEHDALILYKSFIKNSDKEYRIMHHDSEIKVSKE